MYVLDYHQQVKRINQMIPLRKNDRTFEVYYHDPQSGELWKSFFPYGKKKPNGPKLLRPEPLPSNLEHQLELCLNSGNLADAKGLGIEYSLSPEKWDHLINLLDENRKNYTRAGFFTFLNKLGVKNPTKTFEALQIDFNKTPITSEELLSIKKKARKVWIKKLFGI
ncbi:MAG TPA: hypothetical protein DCL80_12620 [Balneola sp.]|jgi:hypothetical protein|nr:hypothetical protein [Balneola sp.]MAO76322.1 hypothetical protein [Balneola sp.]MBF65513.1 hypothetical protein [Balneola sp.]HAH52040.1 hypothetical protein [Balneola sp.]HAW79606.1 hypothetical protein [Balneola sp.]|tara:strand:- start:4445 stop:4942 length:498 start_codon:yes stop_codon:yes gene_type:complete